MIQVFHQKVLSSQTKVVVFLVGVGGVVFTIIPVKHIEERLHTLKIQLSQVSYRTSNSN